MGNRCLQRCGLLAWLAVIPSCVDFDGQTCSFRYDQVGDRLLVFQVYERVFLSAGRVHGEDEEPAPQSLSADEQEQVAGMASGERTYFFNNWLTEYNAANSRKRVGEIEAELKSQLERGTDGAEQSAAAEEVLAELALHRALLASVRAVQARFYLNDAGELCLYQALTIEKPLALVDLANRLISAKVLTEPLDDYSETDRQQILDFAKKDGKWIQLDGNRLVVRFYNTSEGMKKSEKDREKLKSGDEPFFAQNLTFNAPFGELVFGQSDAESTRIRADNLRDGKYNTQVLDYVRGKYPLGEKIEIDTLRQSFFKTATLPAIDATP